MIWMIIALALNIAAVIAILFANRAIDRASSALSDAYKASLLAIQFSAIDRVMLPGSPNSRVESSLRTLSTPRRSNSETTS